MVKFDDFIASCTRHEEPTCPDKKSANKRDGWITLDMTLHQVVIVEKNQLLGLLVVQRIEF